MALTQTRIGCVLEGNLARHAHSTVCKVVKLIFVLIGRQVYDTDCSNYRAEQPCIELHPQDP